MRLRRSAKAKLRLTNHPPGAIIGVYTRLPTGRFTASPGVRVRPMIVFERHVVLILLNAVYLYRQP